MMTMQADRYGTVDFRRMFYWSGEKWVETDRWAVLFRPAAEDAFHDVGVVSDKFTPVLHSQVFDPVEEYLEQNFNGVNLLKAWTARHGAMRRHYYLLASGADGEPTSVEIVGEKLYPILEVQNALCGTLAVKVALGFWRYACANGLMLGRVLKRLGIPPLRLVHRGAEGQFAIEGALQMQQIREVGYKLFPQLMRAAVSQEDANKEFEALPKKSRMEYMLQERLEMKDLRKVWVLLNMITWIATHRASFHTSAILQNRATALVEQVLWQ